MSEKKEKCLCGCGRFVTPNPKAKRKKLYFNETCRSRGFRVRHSGEKNEQSEVVKPSKKKKSTPKKVEEKVANTSSPTTLADIKKLCPPELKGLERTMWINEKKKEYGIQ
mgnify:CR=1 FL=1